MSCFESNVFFWRSLVRRLNCWTNCQISLRRVARSSWASAGEAWPGSCGLATEGGDERRGRRHAVEGGDGRHADGWVVSAVVGEGERLQQGSPVLLLVAEQLGEHGGEGLVEAFGHAVALRVVGGGGALVDGPGLGDGACECLVEAGAAVREDDGGQDRERLEGLEVVVRDLAGGLRLELVGPDEAGEVVGDDEDVVVAVNLDERAEDIHGDALEGAVERGKVDELAWEAGGVRAVARPVACAAGVAGLAVLAEVG